MGWSADACRGPEGANSAGDSLGHALPLGKEAFHDECVVLEYPGRDVVDRREDGVVVRLETLRRWE